MIIANLFDDYRRRVIPHDASTLQVQECKRAFYMGAHALFYAMQALVSDGEEITNQDEILMDMVVQELDNFVQSVMAGSN